MKTDTILQGDALTQLKTLPDQSIDCVMTSPPYWALRDYGVAGQLGLEPTVDEFITKLCDIFDEVQRVLKKSGTCWVNIGDTYGGTGSKGDYVDPKYPNGRTGQRVALNQSMPSKCLVGVPERFSLEMRRRGWILRNTIIWHKPNPMPSSASDRFTVDFDYVYFFVKSQKYWFEQQRERHIRPDVNGKPVGMTKTREGSSFNQGMASKKGGFHDYVAKQGNIREYNPLGRSMRAVWRIATQPFPEAHFATYPEKLCETPIKSGCPQYICVKCGIAREKIIESTVSFESGSGKSGNVPKGKHQDSEEANSGSYDIRMGPIKKETFKGWSSCGCNAGFRPGIVLDPFFGSGTTGLVAKKLGRNYIGIELSNEYILIANKRLSAWQGQRTLTS